MSHMSDILFPLREELLESIHGGVALDGIIGMRRILDEEIQGELFAK